MDARVRTLVHNTFARYLFAIALVAIAFAVRLWLDPWTGIGAPFVLFFAAVLAASLFAGTGPGICAVLLSIPLGAYTFVIGAGYSIAQASFQSLLFTLDGIVVVYLTSLVKKERQAAREVVELSPDAFFQADLDARFTAVNQAACRLLGYERDELIGKTIFEIIPVDQAFRLKAVRADLLVPGHVHRAEWIQKRKDGTFVPVEVSAHILPGGRWQAFVRDISGRKRVEETLHAVSAELRQTLHTAATGLTHCSRDLRYLSANPAYARYTGLPLEQIIGRPISEVMGLAAFEIIRPRVEQVLRGERVEFEDELPIAGERKHTQVVYTPDRDASGTVIGWVASITDVSERKRIEDELKAANAFLDAIIEHIPLMLFIKESHSLRFIRVNRAGEDLIGWPNRALIGKTAYDFWPKEQAEFFIAKDRETLANGSVVDIPEEPIQTRHHGVRLLHTKKVPIIGTAGDPAYLLGISEDITERKRIEQEQQFLAQVSMTLSGSLDYERTLANLARLVVQHVADWSAIDVMDEDGRLSRLKVASADPERAALCAVLEQMPPDRDLPHIMRSVIESQRPVVVEQVTSTYLESLGQGPEHLQALLATGITSFVAVPILMRGQPLGALFLGSSTLSHVLGQRDLRFAEAVAERAATAIENARLYRDSVHATQLRDQVLGVVAHDLRNPLSAILMQLGALRSRGHEAERRSRKTPEVIERAARRMDRLIQDLLDVAVMESGRLTIQPARLSARELIAGAVDTQRPLASSFSLELRLEVDGDVPDVWGDRDRVLQVFENLIGNAIKFTKAGGCITVGAASRDHEVVFRVADTGSGIAPEDLPRVFDRFWQATRANRHGAGLGLPISKGIIEAHGGRVWVESTPNRGTTFSFSIPQATPEQGRPSGPSGSPLLDGYRAA